MSASDEADDTAKAGGAAEPADHAESVPTLRTITPASVTPMAGTHEPVSSRKRSKSNPDLFMSGFYRFSGFFKAPTSSPTAASLIAAAPMRRRGLRRRISAILIVATLGPVVVVSVVAVALIFSSVQQGIEFEAIRGLQVARGLFLQQVKEVGHRAGNLADDEPLLRALASKPANAPPADPGQASAVASAVRERLRELSRSQGSALLEVTDVVGRVLARCVQGTCTDPGDPGNRAGEALDRSPVIRQALAYERTVSVEVVANHLVTRAALPLCDGALRLLGAAVVSVPVDGRVADRLKAALGAGRDVLIYRGDAPNASTFTVSTGARLLGPPLPEGIMRQDLNSTTPVIPMLIDGRSYSVAFGQIQDVNAQVVGFLGVALDREPLAAARRRASTTLLLGALSALLLAIALADLLSRRLTRTLGNLHAGALSIARGDLDTRITVNSNDEIGDVAEAFRVMTRSLKENQEGLAARVRELVIVHQVGRAVRSLVDLDQVLGSVVGDAVSVLNGKTAALALAVEGTPRRFVVRAIAGEPVGRRLAPVAESVAELGRARRTPAVESDPQLMEAARAAKLTGPLIAAPLTLKDRMVGVILVGRLGEAPFGEADLRLLVTLADQTATAIESARLYSEVRAFSENLEQKVRERTAELENAKAEIERTLRELGAAQGQLIHSERMAGLGLLVAGIAHEVNSPAAAVQGLVDALTDTVQRLGHSAHDLYNLELAPGALRRYFELIDRLLPEMATAPLSSTLESRQRLRKFKSQLAGQQGADVAAAMLAEMGEMGERIFDELRDIAGVKDLAPMAGYLREIAFLARAAGTIRTAIGAIRRIVGALKRYSRLDEAPLERIDVHAGLEDTLVILAHQLKSGAIGINVKRSYGKIPQITAYVGELNQVWTNLIHNAVQSMGQAGELVIETSATADEVTVAIQDSGPGISEEITAHIFEPFFTTKGKGEGTGLGLSITARIVEKHGGRIHVTSQPGRTRFEVVLPVEGPPYGVVTEPLAVGGTPSQGHALPPIPNPDR
jgi:two-component system NtrC family sensor kinase